MRASFSVNIESIKKLVERFKGPRMAALLGEIPRSKGAQALVSQAIADNFDKEGPGWAPLTPLTIRRSLATKTKRTRQTAQVKHRMILQGSGLLKKSVTTPGAKGNICRFEGSKIIWGTDLIYAGVHNRGAEIVPKKKKALAFSDGLGGMIFAKRVKIPPRPFLVIRDIWQRRIGEFVLEKGLNAILRAVRGTA